MDKFKRRRLIALSTVIVLVLGLGLAAYANRSVFRAAIDQLQGNDFPGPGVSEVQFKVENGDNGEVISKRLFEAGVVKNARTTYQYILDRNPTFYPGVFSLRKEMSSAEAVKILSNPDAAVLTRVTINEGWRASVIFSTLSKATGLELSEFQALFEKPEVFGLDSKLINIEGYLFPATYSFEPDLTAKEILQILVDRMQQELVSLKVPSDRIHEVIILASVVEKEVRFPDDFYKAARVFQNRLDINMALQSDATVSYGVGGNTFTTSKADRSDKNRYNTYLYPGLPIGPISSPGSRAIDAVMNPADGKWLYFVSVNLETGETVFTETYEQHLKAVAQWLKWMRENPGYE
jgi:UPF0755 protein